MLPLQSDAVHLEADIKLCTFRNLVEGIMEAQANAVLFDDMDVAVEPFPTFGSVNLDEYLISCVWYEFWGHQLRKVPRRTHQDTWSLLSKPRNIKTSEIPLAESDIERRPHWKSPVDFSGSSEVL